MLLSDDNGCRAPHIVVVAGGIEDEFIALRFAAAVGGAREDGSRSRRIGHEAVRPGTEGKAPHIPPKRSVLPAHAAIRGHCNGADSVATIPGDAGDVHHVTTANS